MQDQLLQHADDVIAESRRLIEELWAAIAKARRLDERLYYLHQRRIEEKFQKQ
ncbi:hypothetical protein [Bradyrhizobium jicamae]|uniref:hypothetical protein n=1 Tax=Bradyrhizobium jicamae TaxID=280332 RepID=UPI001BAC8845|nr:hypothetical protein [Bradyrhizobium jicamae]MBR0939323.1 hypothetical protein [Bradyrhizobium jicamae]